VEYSSVGKWILFSDTANLVHSKVCCFCKKLDAAANLLKEIEECGMEPSIVTFTTLLSAAVHEVCAQSFCNGKKNPHEIYSVSRDEFNF
jgi:hypothetical protein